MPDNLKTQTTDSTPNPENNDPADIIPDPISDDDVDRGGDDFIPDPPAETAPADDKPKMPEYIEDTRRDEIAKAYREQRQANKEGEQEQEDKAEIRGLEGNRYAQVAANQEAEEAGDDPELDPEPPAKEDEEPDMPVEEPAEDKDPTVHMIVDGKPIDMPHSEVKALAQQYLASDNRLEKANQLLREATALRDSKAPENQPATPASDPVEPEAPDQSSTAENQRPSEEELSELAGLTEQLQMGDPSEGAQALTEFVRKVVQKSTDQQPNGENLSEDAIQEIVRKTVDSTVAQNQTTTELKSVTDSFAEEFPDLANDPDYVTPIQNAVARGVVEDLKTLGLTDKEFQEYGNDPVRLGGLHRQYLEQGFGVRDHKTLLMDVGQELSDKFNLPKSSSGGEAENEKSAESENKNAQIAKDRIERKRTKQQQPRTANVRRGGQKPKTPKTREQVIQEMRAQRQYPNLA